MPHMVPAVWMRGGTSKCWVFERSALEIAGVSVDDLLLRSFGSPDSRQIDGIGGATSTTSKAVILAPSEDSDIDIDYTFAQVGIEEARVEWGSNCGNCSSVVAVYALDNGWITPRGDETIVRVRNTNTGQVIWEHVRTPEGRWDPELDTAMPGVPFDGISVRLGFVNPAGQTTGRALPTGHAVDTLRIDDFSLSVTLVDAGAPLVVLRAIDLGLVPEQYDSWTASLQDKLADLDRIRRVGAVAMGLASHADTADRAIPKLVLVGPTLDESADLDVVALSMGRVHPALSVTSGIGLAAAAALHGTVVFDALSTADPSTLRLRTPSGIITVWRSSIDSGEVITVERTARTIAHAQLLTPLAGFEAAPAIASDSRFHRPTAPSFPE